MSSGVVSTLAAESKAICGTFCAAAGAAATAIARSQKADSFMMSSSCDRCLSPRGAPRGRRGLQDELLDAPRFDFTEDDFVRVAAVHHVDHLESGRHLPRPAELPQD